MWGCDRFKGGVVYVSTAVQTRDGTNYRLPRMKIGYILQRFPVLSETFIYDQVLGLAGMGYEVKILSFEKPRGGERPLPLDSNISVHYIDIPSSYGHRLRRASGLLSRGQLLRQARSLDPLRYGGDATSLYLYYAVSYLHVLEDCDILICHFGPMGVLGTCLKGLGYQGKVVTFFHGFDVSSYLKGREGPYRRLFREGDLFLPISQHWMSRLLTMGCPEGRTMVHHMGIGVDKFEFKERQRAAGSPTTLLTVGRLVDKKGHEAALRVVARLLRSSRNVEYLVVGDGPLRPRLERMAAELGIAGRVTFTGPIDDEALLRTYGRSHIFLLPSVTSESGDMEGIPVVLMEAMAMGLPVVSTLHSGIPELVTNGESGFLVPERDEEGLFECLARLIDEPGLWPQMGGEGRSMVEAEFDVRSLNTRLVEVLEELVLSGG